MAGYDATQASKERQQTSNPDLKYFLGLSMFGDLANIMVIPT